CERWRPSRCSPAISRSSGTDGSHGGRWRSRAPTSRTCSTRARSAPRNGPCPSASVARVVRVTSFVGDHGLLAVFILMFVAAVLPAASELTMVYGGALASGALAGHIAHFHSGLHAYLAVVVVGTVGNTLGAVLGWAIGHYGGHPLL